MSESNDQLHIQPNLLQARQKSVMAHKILVKFQEMGLPIDMNDEVANLAISLGDIWNSHLALTEEMQKLIDECEDWESIANSLTDMYTHIDHVEWHINGIKDLIFKVSKYSYDNSEIDM
ncbi:MAG: hypothetical protein ACJ0BE_05860 [Dehalococcoidia bacterium]|jgi:hypothetical protein